MSQSKNRAFTNMLTNTSRNHYTLIQMVDRKARILLFVTLVLLSFIIEKIIGNQILYNLNFVILVSGSVFCIISIICSVLAIIPKKNKRHLDAEKLKNGSLNPLYYGNYLSMEQQSYEDALMEMSGDSNFAHRSIIKDIYHIGTILERKRRYLKFSVVSMSIGVCLTLILSIIFKIAYIS